MAVAVGVVVAALAVGTFGDTGHNFLLDRLFVDDALLSLVLTLGSSLCSLLLFLQLLLQLLLAGVGGDAVGVCGSALGPDALLLGLDPLFLQRLL